MAKEATKTNGTPNLLESIQQLLQIDEATLDAAIEAAREKVQAATGELNQLMLLKKSIDVRAGRLVRKKGVRRAKVQANGTVAPAADIGSLVELIRSRLNFQPARSQTLANDLNQTEGAILRAISSSPGVFMKGTDGLYRVRREEKDD